MASVWIPRVGYSINFEGMKEWRSEGIKGALMLSIAPMMPNKVIEIDAMNVYGRA